MLQKQYKEFLLTLHPDSPNLSIIYDHITVIRTINVGTTLLHNPWSPQCPFPVQAPLQNHTLLVISL